MEDFGGTFLPKKGGQRQLFCKSQGVGLRRNKSWWDVYIGIGRSKEQSRTRNRKTTSGGKPSKRTCQLAQAAMLCDKKSGVTPRRHSQGYLSETNAAEPTQ